MKQQGDYNYINGLVKKNNFNKYFIDKILTKTTFDDMKIGNFGKKESYQHNSFISKG